ncbi:RES family NAD+ phosphorylase [Qipengyuania sp. CAU 1752]
MSNECGDCETCGAEDANLIEATELGDKFELVCGIYEPSEDGKRLIDWLIDDWQLFSLENANATILLGEILDDANRVRQTYAPSEMAASKNLDVWETLRDELRTQNRFFPKTDINTARVGSLLEYLRIPSEKLPEVWYRARIEDGSGQIPADKMGAPPARWASPGRANPVGIPYLYVGSAKATAITEVRPHPGETLTLAEFRVEEGVQLIDLRKPRQMITPFVMAEIAEVAAVRGEIDFLERLGKELTTPVLPNAAAVDYIPSQYLCELIKQVGYDGVIYESSVSDGINLALFSPSKAQVGELSRARIDQVSVDFASLANAPAA